MPDTSSYSGLPVPLLSESANLPDALLRFREALDSHIVLFAESVSDMTARFGSASAGTLVSIPSLPAVYQKLSSTANTWRVASEDTGWQSFSSGVWAANWTDVGSGWRRLNGMTLVDLRATWTGDQVDAPSTGNIPDLPVMTLPSGVNPVHQQVPSNFLASSPGTLVAYVAGNVAITHIYSNGALNNGTTLTASFSFARA